MSLLKLQSKVQIIGSPSENQDGSWRVSLYINDGSNTFDQHDISVGDTLLLDTNQIEKPSITSFTIVNIHGLINNILVDCDISYDSDNDNTVQITSFTNIDTVGVITKPTSNLNLFSTISPGYQILPDWWAEYVSNINLQRLDDNLSSIIGLDSNGDYVAQTSSDAVSILDDIQNLIQDIENLQTDAIVDGDFDSAGFMVTDGNGSYSVTSISALGAGDMLSSLYDSNGDGIVNSADNVGGFTVGVDVPADAVFTDTVYTNSDVDLYLNSDSAGDGQVLSWDSAGGSYVWVDKGNTLFNISDNVQGVAVSAGSKLLTGDIEMDTGSELTAAGCIINFGSSTIVGNAFNSVINHHIWEGTTKPTDGYVLSWDETLHANDGGYAWVENPAPTGDSNRVVYDLTDPANSVILDAGDGISHATYKGDVIDSAGNTIVDISSTSATFTGTLAGSVSGNSTTPDGQYTILDVGTDGTDGILNIANITADGTVNFTGATVIGLDSAGYATSSDISDLQLQITNITEADSILNNFQELIDYVRNLDSAQDLSLIQDIADLQANVLFDSDFDSAGIMVRNAIAGDYSVITDNSSNWDLAHSWGDHSSEGYLTTTTWTLTANGSSDYVFSGPGFESGSANDPDIFLVRGQTYKFDNQSGGHPFEIRTSSGGSAYTSGVTQSGTVTTFTVPMDAPDKLYYQCTSHSSMLGNIIISDHSKSLVDSDFDSAGLMVTDGAGNYSSITNNSSNWNTAYGWGDHRLEGYSKVEISDDPPGTDSGSVPPQIGDLWWNSSEGNLKIFYGNATDTAGDDIWVDASTSGYSGGSGGSSSSSSSITNGTNGINVTNNTTSGYNSNAIEFETDNGNTSGVRWRFTPDGHLLPSSNANFDLGNAEYKVRHLFLSDNSLRFGKDGTDDVSGNYVSFGKNNLDRNAEVYTDGDILDDEFQTPVTEPTPLSAGKKGDIRIIGGFMYVCIRTAEVEDGTPNWVRSVVEPSW